MVLLTSLITPMSLLDFGVSEATVKYVAEAFGRRDFDQVGRYARSTLIFNLSTGMLGSLAISILAGFLTTSVFNIPPESQRMAKECLYWVGLIWLLTQARQIFIGVVTALERFDILNTGTFVYQTAMTLTGIGVLWLGGDLLSLIQAQAVLGLLAAAGWLLAAKSLLPRVSFFPQLDWPAFRKTIQFGFWQMLTSVGGLLAHQSQRWFLGALLPISAVGFYNVSFQLASMVYLLTFRMGQVLFPAISQMQGQERDEEAIRLTIQANWILSMLSIAGLVPVAVFGHDLLFLWVGPEIADQAATLLRILTLGLAVSCLFPSHNFYLLGTGRASWLAIMSFVQGVITVVISWFLIPNLGLPGAGWGLTAGTITHVAVLMKMWKRFFRRTISLPVFISATFSQCLVGVCLAIGMIAIRREVIWSPHWISLGCAGLACSAFTGFTIFVLDGVLPGGKERRQLLVRISARLVPAWTRLKNQT